MLKIDERIDLKWLMYEFQLKYANHVDEPGKYLFFSDTFYINTYDKVIHIDGRNENDLLFLYDLIKANLVVAERRK